MAASNILKSEIERFRCFRCKNYLSMSPIVLLPDGNSLCGICSTSTEETTYREFILEDFLKIFKYPCKFKKYGCTAHLGFGETQEHQAKCIHRPRTCPVLPSCAWKGTVQQMFDHFNTDHSDLVADKMEFKLNICDRNEDALLFTHINGIGGILRYFYSFALDNLRYNIQHFSIDYEEIPVKISLTNDLDPDYKVHVKGAASSFLNKSFCGDFHKDPNTKTLSLNNFFPVLNNPDCISVSMNWQVAKSKKVIKGNEEAQSANSSEEEELVNYALIETLKCGICKSYLLPPLYKKPGSACVMCWYCHNKYTKAEPVLGQDILQKVAKSYFPCRWRGCEVIRPGSDLISHELSCMLRMYNCYDCAKNTFTRENIILHTKEHGSVYFKDCHTFDVCFISASRDSDVRRFLTFKDDSILYITCDICPGSCWFELRSEYSKDSIVYVEFEHDHCKVRPKTFVCKPSESLQVRKDNLPLCFNNDQQIKVTLKV